MIKFILGTFALLVFGFYQLSGGADFEPRRALAVAETETQPQTNSANPAAIKAAVPEVTRVALDLTAVSPSVSKPAIPMVDAEKAKAVAPALKTVVPQAEKTETVAIIPSIVRDVRRISGNRVNIRSGPGKTYGVVTQLTRGVSVEIVADNGDGWVKMRPVDGGQIGWVADFLLTDAQG